MKTAVPHRTGSARPALRKSLGGVALASVLLGTMVACGPAETTGQGGQAPAENEAAAEVTAEIPDLTGVWESTEDSDFSQRAVIAGSYMTVDWVEEGGTDSRLYWAGTFEAPTAEGAHIWTSSNDHGRTDSELLASGADTKDFTFEDGVISFEASALGEDGVVTLEQTSDTVPAGTATEAAPAEAAGQAQIVDSGFAVQGDYAWVTAMVEYEGLTGEFATVLFNVYDAEDTLIASTEQVEEFGTAGTTFPIGTQVDVPSGSTIARVEATVSVSDHGNGPEPMPVLEPIEAPADNPRFTIENTTGEDWENPRIAIVCYDGAGGIVGGSSEYPSIIPAGGEVLVSDEYMIIGDEAVTCSAHVQLTRPL